MATLGDWDKSKNRQNIKKHRISINEAIEVFDDPLFNSYVDELNSIDETRYITIGETHSGKMIIVSHTDSRIQTCDIGNEVIRIISARKVTSKERRIYANG